MSKQNIIWPDKIYFHELIRPWKLLTFTIAMTWLLYGALFYEIGDWDVGVTLIMGILTYVLAPWSVHLIWTAIHHRPSNWYVYILIAMTCALFVVDWVYILYHTVVGNPIYRAANFNASLPLYFLAGTFWLYRGSVKEFITNIKDLTKPKD